MDFNAITEVNGSWVFSEGNGRDRATPELLRSIHADAMQNAIFYERMCKELGAIVDREQGKLKQRHCPTTEEIQAAGSIADQIEPKLQREYYLADAAAVSGMCEMMQEIFLKHMHAEKIKRQAAMALEGVR